MPDSNSHDGVILTSYPRSGNTLLRAYLEKIMGLVTGSDCDIDKKLNKELLHMGLSGEGLIDRRVWVIKTHYPERYGKTKFYAERCILCVRNPIDCITSLFNMVCTGTHNRSIDLGDYSKYKEMWTEFVEQEITVWKDFHDFWIKAKIPVHIVRYEDITKNPKPTLMGVLKFILNEKDLSNTRIEKYIDLATGEKSPEIYKPRLGAHKSNAEKFTPKHLEFMLHYAKELIANLGYERTYAPEEGKQGGEGEMGSGFLEKFNEESWKKSVFAEKESEDITSIFINYPALLLRKKSVLYPEGRTSYRFKKALRKKVTVNGGGGLEKEEPESAASS